MAFRQAPTNPAADACLWAPALVVAASILVLAALAQGGWPGRTGVSGTIFCEILRDGPVKQPANTFSNLGFIVVGLWVGWRARRDLRTGDLVGRRNPMVTTAFFPGFYATIVALLGPGSMAMHASSAAWGGRVDVFSMHLWAATVLAYAVTRLADLTRGGFAGIWIAIVATLAGFLFTGSFPISVDVVFGLLIAAYALLEVAIRLRRPDLASDRRWLAAALGLFAVAFAIWIPSRTGGPLCDPDSWVQGHAIWHLLCAGSVAALFAFYRSERRTV